jgi:hypothetical protein
MAKRKKTGGRDFRKGESGNPKGRPPLPADLKGVRELSADHFRKLATFYLERPFEEVEKLRFDPEVPALHRLVISVIWHAVDDGCYSRLNFLLDRLVGKVKDQADLNVNVTGLSDAELVAKAKAALKVLQQQQKGKG